jgi:hypothetical protein
MAIVLVKLKESYQFSGLSIKMTLPILLNGHLQPSSESGNPDGNPYMNVVLLREENFYRVGLANRSTEVFLNGEADLQLLGLIRRKNGQVLVRENLFVVHD